MKTTTKILVSLILVVAGLLFARIIMSSAFSVDGITLAAMNTQIANLDKENIRLKEEVYTKSSYTTIASDAAQMGFVEERTQIAVNGVSSLAIKQ